MEKDDLDFTPSQGTSSNLASLFGFTKKPLEGNPTLTYTAPKAPKKELEPSKTLQQAEEKKNKAVIICLKAVQAYKLENRTYVNQGLAGVVISGNHEAHTYAIILYKPSKEHLSRKTITRTFTLTLSANNYVSFYDNGRQNWSIMFQSSGDMIQFLEKVAISKFYCQPEPSENILIQDLIPESNSAHHSNSIVDVIYSSFSLDQESVAVIKENIKEKINLSDSNSTLAKGLIGCSKNCYRIIIVPHSLSGTWVNDLGSNKDLLFRVKVEKITSLLGSSLMSSASLADGTESPVESSTEEKEINIKSKGASIKEALATTKSQKANLISRMAKMGQATLPLKEELDGPSDSEEECSVAPLSKSRISRNRPGINNYHNASSYPSETTIPETAKQLSVYQNDLSWQQGQITKIGVPHQILPMPANSSLSAATDPGLSVYMSESRIQAAELRMSISKISEKLDTVLDKVQNLNNTSPDFRTHPTALQDSSAILSSIQSIIAENEKLKARTEEQKEKLEQQNDRIFHLLELNHKYLEQSSTTNEKQSETELKLRKEIEVYLKKEIQWEAESKKYLEKIKSLEEELEKSEEMKKKMKETSDELTSELDKCKKHIEGNNSMKALVESYEDKIAEASSVVMKLKAKLKEIMSEKETLKSVVEAQKETIEANKTEVEDLKIRSKEYEKSIENLMKKSLSDESKYESSIDNYKKFVERLEGEKKNLLSELEKEKENQKIEMDKHMIGIFSNLKESFAESSEYPTALILSIIEKCFNNFNFVKKEKCIDKETPNVESEKEFVSVPSATCNFQNIDIIKNEKNDSRASSSEIEEKEVQETEKKEEKEKDSEREKEFVEKEIKEEENDSRYKSYDQSWRTTKPPPPPLFDDEDDEDDWLN